MCRFDIGVAKFKKNNSPKHGGGILFKMQLILINKPRCDQVYNRMTSVIVDYGQCKLSSEFVSHLFHADSFTLIQLLTNN